MTNIVALAGRQSSLQSEQGATLAHAQKHFLERLPDRIAAVATAWNKLKYINWDTSILENLGKAVNVLHDASQNVLLPRLADRTAELCHALKLAVEQGYATGHQRSDIDNALSQLSDTGEMARRYSNKALEADAGGVSSPVLCIHVALVEEDPHHAAMTSHLLEQSGYQVTVYTHPRALQTALSTTFFNVILLDTTYHDGALAGVIWLERSKEALQDTAVIMLSARTDMVARLRSVRAGAQAYVVKSSDITLLHHKLQQTLQYLHHPKDHVLLVDNNAQRMSLMADSLMQDGFVVDTLDRPLLLLDRLMRLRPDVLVLNYDLPGCNGIELGNLLRQDPSLMSIPIVYLADSDHANPAREALQLLGNACIDLPVDMARLGATLRQEVRRARLVTGLQVVDAPRSFEQRLQHRAAFFSGLETLLSDAKKQENRSTPWYLAYVAVDGYAALKKNLRLRTLIELEETLEHTLASRPETNGLGCSLGEMRYLLVLRDIEGMGGEVLAKRLHAAVVRQHQGNFTETDGMRLSMGVAPLHVLQNLDDALEQTEQACYRSQREGGNQIAWSTVVPMRKTPLTSPMRQALRNRSFKLVYQPIVNLDHQDVWFEALVRLVDAQGQTYLPHQFLDWVDTDMEGGKFMLDRWIIDQGLQALTQLGGKNGAGYSLIVKLTPDLLQCERLLPYLSNVVNGARLRGVRRTTVALPESCVMRDIPRARRLIKSIHGLNCGFMLEHVTLTPQSLQPLKDLGPIDLIKLHPNWRQQIESDRTFRGLLQRMVQMMPETKLVASHVEDAKTFATLWESGVRYFQGYFIQEPGEKLTAAPFEAAV